MKPSDSKERTRERKQRQRMSHPPVTPPDVTPQHSKGLTRSNTVPIISYSMAEHLLTASAASKGRIRTPEEHGYPPGQVEVRTGPQGQQLWRLNGHYDMPNRILCFNASKDSFNPRWADSLT